MTRFNLRNNGTVKAEGRAPPVLPVVVYNGERPWTAAGARAGSVAAPETAVQLSDLLTDVEEPEDLIAAGEWIVDCRSGDELLERCRLSSEA